tara:strand:- start:310 stop:456 length:147 start_codon:yes stop_codon:yes gene_type:complete
MKEVILNTIENKRDAELMIGIVEDLLKEQGIDTDTFSFEIKVFYEDEG